jgi:tRNA/tmRNA/rRNA uracil-C5-methylase (TrmA/RlmC/RlmD family)
MNLAAGDPPKAVDLLDLTVGEVVHGGWCIARTGGVPAPAGGSPSAGGRVIFVRHALPGEQVRVMITQTTSKFARADAVQILIPSADRVEPRCPHARPGGCGGCDWQHASMPAQRALKAAVIRQQLRRIAGIDRDVLVEPLDGDEDGLGWRTRVKFAVRPDGTAGLRRHRSHQVAAIDTCPIAHQLVSDVGVTRERWPGVRSVEVAVAPKAAEQAVIVSGGPARFKSWPDFAADSVLAPVPDGGLTALRGSGFLHQQAAGRSWRVSAGTFWQVHPGAATALAEAVLGALAPRPGDVALDLYCGAGLFAGVLADAVGPDGAVIAIEEETSAVRDARHNLRSTPWARVHKGDAAAMLARYGVSGASLAVLDPPRAGAARQVVELLAAAGTDAALNRIAYVSCDPATLARDLAMFGEHGWDLAELRAFDAFPMTHHVECLATLTRW